MTTSCVHLATNSQQSFFFKYSHICSHFSSLSKVFSPCTFCHQLLQKTSYFLFAITLGLNYCFLFMFFALKGDGVWKAVQARSRQRGKAVIMDIIDGKYYTRLCEPGQFLNNPCNISFIFNTDGAPLYSSSCVSLWPVFLAINELPSPDRYVCVW